jgi:hypothetical protein
VGGLGVGFDGGDAGAADLVGSEVDILREGDSGGSR